MSDNKIGNDNELLVEFEFLIDLDIALFKYVQANYSTSKYVDEKIINMKNDYNIINMLLYRKHINPLEIIMPNINTTSLYKEILETKEEDLLKYSILHDTFYLMVTYLNTASSLSGITVWCKNELESNFIKKHNNHLNTIIVPSRSKIDLNKYTSIYMKFFAYAAEYKNLAGKNIYIANAKYNFDEKTTTINGLMSVLYADVNMIKLIDIYTKVKYTYNKGDTNNDIFEHSSRGESTRNTEGNT